MGETPLHPDIITGAEDLQTYLQKLKGGELCTTLTKLSGGYTNLTCRSTLPSGKTTIVKHAKTISRPNWPVALSANRARGEQEMLNHIATELPFVTHQLSAIRAPDVGDDDVEAGAGDGEGERVREIEIGTPRGLGYFEEHHVQIIEDFPGTADFESLLLEGHILDEGLLYGIGEALGKWLRAFHTWGRCSERAALREVLANNGCGPIKEHSHLQRLRTAVRLYPQATANVAHIINSEFGTAPRINHDDDTSYHTIVHGDFWHGNILVTRKESRATQSSLPLKIIDWEMSRVGTAAWDIGQFFAECRILSLFKSRPEALASLTGFMAGYGAIGREEAFDVAIMYGAQLMTVPEYLADWVDDATHVQDERRCVEEGAVFLERAWARDGGFFKGGALGEWFR